ncbi:MAG: hypothetical protein ACK559_15370, partial [bacterium]
MTEAIQNIQNDDNKCFYYSIFAHFYNIHSMQTEGRVRSDLEHLVPYIKSNSSLLNFDGIEFPTVFDGDVFNKFEEQNPNIALKVYYFHHESEEDKEGQLHRSYVKEERFT